MKTKKVNQKLRSLIPKEFYLVQHGLTIRNMEDDKHIGEKDIRFLITSMKNEMRENLSQKEQTSQEQRDTRNERLVVEIGRGYHNEGNNTQRREKSRNLGQSRNNNQRNRKDNHHKNSNNERYYTPGHWNNRRKPSNNRNNEITNNQTTMGTKMVSLTIVFPTVMTKRTCKQMLVTTFTTTFAYTDIQLTLTNAGTFQVNRH